MLTGEQFFEALRKGQGRALIRVREHGDEGLEDEIRRACIYDLRYDLQTAESRVPWIAEILAACRDDAPYRCAVYAALGATADSLSRHLSQRCSLTKHWAASGDSTARKTLYDVFERAGFGWRELIELDGDEGMRRVASALERLASLDFFDAGSAVKAAPDEAAAWAHLEAAAAGSPVVRELVDEARETARLWAQPRTAPERPSFETICERIRSGRREGFQCGPSAFSRVAKDLSDREFEQLYEWLLAERKPEPLLRLLGVFMVRRAPRLHQRLFDLARSDDAKMRWQARRALALFEDTAVRNFALELFDGEGPTALARRALLLFERNWRDEDAERIEALLELPEDADDLHWIGTDLLGVAEANASPVLTGCLLWVYEHSPCGHCRGEAVRELIRRKTLPDELRRECRYDAVTSTRALVADLQPSRAGD